MAKINDAVQTVLEFFQRFLRIKARGITTDADVNLLAVMDRPREIAWSDPRIKKTMKSRRTVQRYVLEYFFDADNPFTILIQPQGTSYARICPISTYDQTRVHLLFASLTLKMYGGAGFRISDARESCFRHPFDTRLETVIQKSLIQQTHSADTELLMRTFEIHRSEPRRIKRDVPHRRTEAFFRKLKVFQRPSHEDSGRVHGMCKRRFSVNQEYAKTLGRQQTRAL